MTANGALLPAALLSLLGLSACVAPAGPPDYAHTLPPFSLGDPSGERHERNAVLAEGGLLVVVTAPTLASGDAQEAWSDALAATAPADGRWVLLEDMSQSSFPDTARGRMEEEFDPSRSPLLLLDLDGALRRGLGIPEEATVVLVFDAGGHLVHADASAASEAGARRAWAALALTN